MPQSSRARSSPRHLLVAAAPAVAAPRGTQPRNQDDDTQVVITGRVVVAQQETVGDVAILNGDARINGSVDGSVFALNGDVIVRGSVKDDVLARERAGHRGGRRPHRGRRHLSRDGAHLPGATVDGDVKSVSQPVRARSGRRRRGDPPVARRDRVDLGVRAAVALDCAPCRDGSPTPDVRRSARRSVSASPPRSGCRSSG